MKAVKVATLAAEVLLEASDEAIAELWRHRPKMMKSLSHKVCLRENEFDSLFKEILDAGHQICLNFESKNGLPPAIERCFLVQNFATKYNEPVACVVNVLKSMYEKYARS